MKRHLLILLLILCTSSLAPAQGPETVPGYLSWAIGEGIPEGQRGFEETPAGDGVPNLIKFACGLPGMTPVSPEEVYRLSMDTPTRSLAVSFGVAGTNESAFVTPEWTRDLQAEWRADGFGADREGPAGAQETWKASLPLRDMQFVRLRASTDADAAWRRYRSPYDLAYAPGGGLIAVSDQGFGLVYLVPSSGATPESVRSVTLHGEPTGVAWLNDQALYVSEYGAGTIAEIEVGPGSTGVVRRIATGPKPLGLAVAPQRGLLLSCDFGLHEVRLINLSNGVERARVPVLNHPGFIAVTPDEALAVVANTLPGESAADLSSSAQVTVIDLATETVAAHIPMPEGASAIRQVRISPNGRWAYVVHTHGHVALPTFQLDSGWVNTDALSIIDLQTFTRTATVTLDLATEGAADPWGIALSPDGDTMWISIAGVHEIARIDLAGLHAHLDGSAEAGSPLQPGSIWRDIWDGVEDLDALAYHFTALSGPGLMTRTELPLNGPRGIACSPSGNMIVVAGYFSGNLLYIQPATHTIRGNVMLGDQPEANAFRRGETYFHDGTLSYQHWVSCVTCHPGTRVDGLNWDLPNDGIGTHKNTKSLLGAHHTPPTTWTGARANADMSVASGYLYIHFNDVPQDIIDDTSAYLRALRPEPSPHLVDGRLSPDAELGKTLFESPAVGCANCHSGEWFTNLQLYNVGTQAPGSPHAIFDTPSVTEMWRTGPYLHDGRAATLMEVLTTYNTNNLHGVTSHLSPAEKEALVAYLLSL